MDRRQVRYFLAVADHGGFTRAADELHVAQPTLSQAIGALERDLGATLFHRLGRTVRLTSAGEALLEPARRIIRDFGVAEESVAHVRGMRGGRLDLAAIPTLVHTLAELVGQLRERHPEVSIHCPELEVGSSVEAAVVSGGCEIGLAELPAVESGLVAVELGRQPFHLVLAPGTAIHGTFPLARLNDLDLVATPPGTSSRARLEDALAHANGQRRPIKVETGQRDALIALVLAGAGAAFLPEPMAEQARRLGATVASTTPVIQRRFGIIHRAAPLSPAALALLSIATQGSPSSKARTSRTAKH